MGDRENEFRNQLKIEKRSMPDNRSAQQRAIDGARKMTSRDLKTEKISSPNNDEYTKWHKEFAKEINSKGGYIPPDKEISEEIFYKEDR